MHDKKSGNRLTLAKKNPQIKVKWDYLIEKNRFTSVISSKL